MQKYLLYIWNFCGVNFLRYSCGRFKKKKQWDALTKTNLSHPVKVLKSYMFFNKNWTELPFNRSNVQKGQNNHQQWIKKRTTAIL